jgi:hypothetical protein
MGDTIQNFRPGKAKENSENTKKMGRGVVGRVGWNGFKVCR